MKGTKNGVDITAAFKSWKNQVTIKKMIKNPLPVALDFELDCKYVLKTSSSSPMFLSKCFTVKMAFTSVKTCI